MEVGERAALLQSGVRLEILTVAWMTVEAAVSIAAGIAAGSVLLIAFGLDSVIELLSGAVLLWRLHVESGGGDTERSEAAERRAARIAAALLVLLCVYVLVAAVVGLASRSGPESSPWGIAVSAAALLVMPWLAWRKRSLARLIGSRALEEDAAESITCAYMAGTVLLGVGMNALVHWWWVEYLAALVFLAWLGRETLEAVHEATEMEPDAT